MHNRKIVFEAPWQVSLRQEELTLSPGKGEMLVETQYSLISTGTELAFPTPRSWEMVSRILQDVSTDMTVVYPMIVGCVGQTAASGFQTWTELYREMPSVEDIFLGKKVETPNAKELHIALRSAMVAYARNHPKKEQIDNSITYACRLPWSFRGLLLHDYACIPALEPILRQNEVYQMALRDGLQ